MHVCIHACKHTFSACKGLKSGMYIPSWLHKDLSCNLMFMPHLNMHHTRKFIMSEHLVSRQAYKACHMSRVHVLSTTRDMPEMHTHINSSRAQLQHRYYKFSWIWSDICKPCKYHFLTTLTLNFFVGLSFFPLQILLVILWSSFHFKLTNMRLNYCFICTYPSSMKLYSINFTKILIYVCNLHVIIFVSTRTYIVDMYTYLYQLSFRNCVCACEWLLWQEAVQSRCANVHMAVNHGKSPFKQFIPYMLL